MNPTVPGHWPVLKHAVAEAGGTRPGQAQDRSAERPFKAGVRDFRSVHQDLEPQAAHPGFEHEVPGVGEKVLASDPADFSPDLAEARSADLPARLGNVVP